MAQVIRIQLAQPVLSILWTGLLLGEHLTAITGGLAVCVRLNPAPIK